MSATTATASRNRRPHPPQDTSKHYTEVPPTVVKQHNPIYRAIKRLDPEIAFGELEPAEKVVVVIAALVVVALAIGGPVYVIRYALS
ncbi:hypothetical protein NESM_000084000 [Novymonas esmeraldas]|uniref:Uncharacterized protein n=1 Tax=Novymonas esmeraldas TaxID=1808958 RepID=A0AAW0F2E2_9TRYP